MEDNKGLGALTSPPDNRDIPTAAVQAPVARPKEYMLDDSDIPVADQGALGTCVGEAEGGEVEVREFEDTGKVIETAHLDLYGECKLVDGIQNEQGTYPRVAADIKVNRGIVSAKIRPDDRNLSHAEIIERARKPKTTEEAEDASLRVAKGYTFPSLDLESILQAIFQNKGKVTATLDVGDWSKLPVKPSPNRGRHRIRLKGYSELPNGDAMIWFRNSWGRGWGKNGDGYFLWSDYKLHIYEVFVYQDVPMDVILKARQTPYIFTRTLKFGMRGLDVLELQKRLSKEIAKDGQPCYRYKENGVLYLSQYFGKNTEDAVKRYQEVKGIVASGTPETTGYGQTGPKTRDILNGKAPRPELFEGVKRRRDMLTKIMTAVGHPITVTDEYRTKEEQDELYAQGRTKPGKIVTNAKGGESLHNFRVAFDVAFSTKNGISYDGPWEMLAEVAEVLGLAWGGHADRTVEGGPVQWPGFIDKPHLEFNGGYTLKNFQDGQIDESRFA